MNRLANAMSPYLLQHATNPVDWYEWGEEAFAEAKRRDVPVLISVGYSACHWCHVMAHESFEDPDVARLLNENFVSIKVDREERPDVDAVYMAATQAMTGQGGWPMTVFATPDGEPFFCGTYYPKVQFLRLLSALTTAWREQRDEVVRQGSTVAQALATLGGPVGRSAPLSAELLDAAAAQLKTEHDQRNGGFGDAPKFPPHMVLLFLLRHHERTGDPDALEIVRHTCEQMARGGIYDQLAGGFARYSVDATWTVPHFEKMLYDNALLLRVYTHLWRKIGGDGGAGGLAGRVARQTADFLLRDLLLPEGGFASALDADTEGVEGATYVWTPQQLRDVLGEVDGDWAADLFEVTPAGNFERGTSVLRLARDIDEADPALVRRWESVRERLAAARAARPQPARDDKVVAAWNGLAVTALAEHLAFIRTLTADAPDPALAGRSERLTEVVRRAAELLTRHLVDGRLRRVSRGGVVGEPAGVLEDYGAVAEAFCAMHQLTGEGRWLELAGTLLDTALARFGRGDGGFHDTADDAEQLVARPADPTDNATPSGLSAMAAALTSYAALTGDTSYREAAERALATVTPLLPRHSRFTGYACAVAEALESGPYEIVIATDDPVRDPLVRTARRLAPPGAVIVAGEPDRPGVPLLAGRSRRDGASTAYVCRGFVCDRPVTDPDELAGQLA
ncbi:MAG TPA: thioredoxin domain-containing protein [Natronosporangium sp.]|nr:thioredoxin domain-containing protein [Natronosporangium sp.]